MADRSSRRRTRIADVDHEEIRRLAVQARDSGWDEAPEIGRAVARALDKTFRNTKAEKNVRKQAYINLVGLAAQGSVAYAKRVLQEASIRVTRQGETIRIHDAFALPSTVVTNGNGTTPVTPGGQQPAQPPRKTNLYVQFGFMTWPMFHILRDQIDRKIGGLSATAVTLDEIAKLESLFPDCTVGEAMLNVGLDPDTLEINLDDVQPPATGTE